MDSTEKRRGHYLGTEIDEKWWRRHSRDGLLARGRGEYWFDASAFFFRRYLTDTPIVISFGDVLDVKVGKWHSGRWAFGAPVVKIVWSKGNNRLSSGFVCSADARETELLVRDIRSLSPHRSGMNAVSIPGRGAIGRNESVASFRRSFAVFSRRALYGVGGPQ